MSVNLKTARILDRQPLDMRIESMMSRLLVLMEDFSSLGQTDEAGPHIHELMNIAYGAGAPGVSSMVVGSLPRKPASK